MVRRSRSYAHARMNERASERANERTNKHRATNDERQHEQRRYKRERKTYFILRHKEEQTKTKAGAN